jgi:putative membrane protein
MKRLASRLLIISGGIFLASCGNNSSTSDSNTTTSADSSYGDSSNMASMDKTRNDTTGAMGTAAPDVNTPGGFAMTAASGGMMEVELANMAQQKAAGKDVKDFAKMIEQDHTKANNELKGIAATKNINLPSAMMADHQMHVNDLNSKSGVDFDKAYIDMMVEDHNQDINMFKTASNNMSDADLKTFATKTLPVLQKHLDRAKALQTKMNK